MFVKYFKKTGYAFWSGLDYYQRGCSFLLEKGDIQHIIGSQF